MSIDLLSYWWAYAIVLIIIFNKLVLRLFGVVRIPEDKIGLIRKKFKLFGKFKELPPDRIVALNGESGYQAMTLAPGLYFGYWPWQYKVESQPFTVIQPGNMGLVIARDGASLESDRILGRRIECDNFQDAVKFLTNNGQKGRQSAVILTGSYRINTLLFEIQQVPITMIPPNKLAIVTTLDGKPLPKDEIAGDPVEGHNNYQDFDKFVFSGGWRGLQQQVLLAGAWNLNPWAVQIRVVDMLDVPIGYVGVVNSFVGEEGVDTSGVAFEHGNIVSKGQKGVWKETFGPGKYAINSSIMNVELVPTTNLVLNWATGRSESHELDRNLSTITVRSKDGFTFNLDVSQIIHIPAVEAPKVIARFGNMKNLVSQVLEPTIGNYFRNSAQDSDVIDFLKTRQERQRSARDHIEQVLVQYNVKAVDTLIGDITPPSQLMETLTNRKLAQENKMTYQAQEEAQKQRQELEKQRSLADIQPRIVESARGVEISENNASARIKNANGEAEAIKLQAAAEAERIRLTGFAEAEKVEKIGAATATAYDKQVQAMGQDNFTRFQIIERIAEGKVRIMPDTLIMGGKDGGANVMDGILANILMMQTKSVNGGTTPSKGDQK